MMEGRLGETIGIREELIKEACSLSFKAHRAGKPYVFEKRRGSSEAVFSFPGSWSVEDWFSGRPFGNTEADPNLFPSLRSIGNNEVAVVNEAFFQRFEAILRTTSFANEAKKAMTERKLIVFTGHSSGGPIAILATLWFLEECIRPIGSPITPLCVTFGSPLLGDCIIPHALRREKWDTYFIHFVMRYDIVPRLMLAPLSSTERELQLVLHFFNPESPSFGNNSIATAGEASVFFTNVMRNVSSVASHTACNLMGSANPLLETVTSFIELSPYRPFGTYIFCIGNGKLVVVQNSEAALQLLFHICQLECEAEIAEVAGKSLKEHLGYENELQRSLQKQNVAYLDNHLSELPLSSDGRARGEMGKVNIALNDLGLSTRGRLCLRAAGELQKQKQRNQDKIENKYKSEIESKLKHIRKYQIGREVHKVGYYDSFKLHYTVEDWLANVKRIELAGMWDEIIEMLKRNELADEFEGQREWIELGTEYRRLLEPLEIANYYRHIRNYDTGPYLIKARPKRYRYTQRWLEYAERMEKGSILESCLWARVEELRISNKSVEDMKKHILDLETDLLKWVHHRNSKERFMSKSFLPQEDTLNAVKLCTGEGMKDLEKPARFETQAIDPENRSIISDVFANSQENKDKDKASVKVYTRRVGQEVFWDKKLHRTFKELEMDPEIFRDLRDYEMCLMFEQLTMHPESFWENFRINSESCWDTMELEHPATLEELGMHPENKGIISDFLGFVRAEEFRKRIGQALRNDNCLVYDSPGIDRRSIIAAMANYLKFDTYHLDLTSFSSLWELNYTLLSTRNRSVIAIEGLYHCDGMVLNLTTDEILNKIDELLLWRRDDEQIFVFTTNHRDQHDVVMNLATWKGYFLGDERPDDVIRLSMDGKLASRLQLIHISWLGRCLPRPPALPPRGEIVRPPLALSLSQLPSTSNRAQLAGLNRSGSTASDFQNERTRDQPKGRKGKIKNLTTENLRQFVHLKRADAAKELEVGESTFKRHCRSLGIKEWPNLPPKEVFIPLDGNGENNPPPMSNMLSTNGQITMEIELGGPNSEPNERLPNSFEDPNFQNIGNGSIAEFENPTTFYDCDADFLFPAVFNGTEAAWGSGYLWEQGSESSDFMFPVYSDAAAPSQSVPILQTMPHPQIASTQILRENMGSFEDLRSFLAPQKEPLPEGHVFGSVNCTIDSIVDLALSHDMPNAADTVESSEYLRDPLASVVGHLMEKNHYESSNLIDTSCSNLAPSQLMQPTIPHMTPLLTERQDLRFMKLDATYGEDLIKLHLPLTFGILELKQAVSKQLELGLDSFKVKYEDERGRWILITHDEEVREHLQRISSGNQVNNLLVVNKVPKTTDFCGNCECDKCRSLKGKRP